MSTLLKEKKRAAVRLALEIETATSDVAEAMTEMDKIDAATRLAFLFNDNVEMVIWALKFAGDMPSAKRDSKRTQPSRPLGCPPPTPNFLTSGDDRR